MANINTEDLEYAASVSADGLEIFFTRLKKSQIENKKLSSAIYHAVRPSLDEPFSEPSLVESIGQEHFVEGPAISADGSELYYHQFNGKKFSLFKVTR